MATIGKSRVFLQTSTEMAAHQAKVRATTERNRHIMSALIRKAEEPRLIVWFEGEDTAWNWDSEWQLFETNVRTVERAVEAFVAAHGGKIVMGEDNSGTWLPENGQARRMEFDRTWM